MYFFGLILVVIEFMLAGLYVYFGVDDRHEGKSGASSFAVATIMFGFVLLTLTSLVIKSLP